MRQANLSLPAPSIGYSQPTLPACVQTCPAVVQEDEQRTINPSGMVEGVRMSETHKLLLSAYYTEKRFAQFIASSLHQRLGCVTLFPIGVLALRAFADKHSLT